MSDPTERDVAAALQSAPPVVLWPGPRELPTEFPPAPDEYWELPGGMAWVYYGQGNDGLRQPVILADGAGSGPSTLEFSWAFVETGNFPFISSLRRRGKDVILLGYQERSASILRNSQAATGAILRAIVQRAGDERLVVGGFSMGGLVTRYALAKLETERMDHQTKLYFSYDSELERVGSWPRIPRRIAVANGCGTGVGNGIKPGQTAVRGTGLGITGTDLRTMPIDTDRLVGTLRVITAQKGEVHATGLPDIDGAPGSTLPSFEILSDALNKVIGLGVDNPITDHCFIPAVSAVDLRDLDTHDNLYTIIDDVDPTESNLDEFMLASDNDPHATLSEELCTWLLDRF